MRKALSCFIALFVLVPLLAAAALAATPEARIGEVLDKLHEYASKAQGEAYLALFAKDAVFFGTDKTERWPITEFGPYAKARFDTGTGWTYRVLERNIYLSGDKKTAWFDERLDHAASEARGTGVLLLEGANWKIVQYNLSFPVPNELFSPIYDMIKIYEEKE